MSKEKLWKVNFIRLCRIWIRVFFLISLPNPVFSQRSDSHKTHSNPKPCRHLPSEWRILTEITQGISFYLDLWRETGALPWCKGKNMHGVLASEMRITTLFCLLLKKSSDEPYLKHLDFSQLFVADAPMKKITKFSTSTLKYIFFSLKKICVMSLWYRNSAGPESM